MEWKLLATVFATVFLAELGDKTQLATFLFAADRDTARWTVFIGASAALIASSAVAVLAGSWIAQHIQERHLSLAAGLGFVLIGLWTIYRA